MKLNFRTKLTWTERAARIRGAVERGEFAERVFALADVAPALTPSLVAGGVGLTQALRTALGERPVDTTLWEELLALRRGPGTDAFFAMPVPPKPQPEDPLLERAVEILALVDAVRNNRRSHQGQPLDRILREGVLRTRRVVLHQETVPVCIRLGFFFAIVHVGEEHPRSLRDRIVQAFAEEARSLGTLRGRRIPAPILVSITPLPLAEALHAHRIGVEGPWLGWSRSAGRNPMGVLASHHLVLEGPGFATLRADFRRRVRAMRVALGLDGIDEGWDVTEEFSEFDSAPFEPYGRSVEPELHPALKRMVGIDDDEPCRDDRQHHSFAFDPSPGPPSDGLVEVPDNLPPELDTLARVRPSVWSGDRMLGGPRRGPPSIRYATVNRCAFSFPDFVYAYCRAQHDALAVFSPRYAGTGFTFIVPRDRPHGLADGGRRARPVLCTFKTRRGAAESAESFKARLEQRFDEAEAGHDLLSGVLDDAVRMALPNLLKAAVVRAFERLSGDGGTFLAGRGLVSHIEIPEEVVDPIAQFAGIYEGVFGGSCQERGGVAMAAVDRGSRRDISALGTGIFRRKEPMDLFWQRFAWFLGEAAK